MHIHFNADNTKMVYLLLSSILIMLCGDIHSIIADKSDFYGIFQLHLRVGGELLNGQTPVNPSFPMFGYSLLSAGLGKWPLLIMQNIICLASIYLIFKQTITKSNTLIVATLPLLLLPWLLLGSSFYSNSVSATLIVLGTCILIQYIHTRPYLAAGVAGICYGLSYNIRAEALLFVAAIFCATLIHGFFSKRLKSLGQASLLMLLLFALFTIPWGIWTKNTVDEYRLTSSNGGAVKYLGLGYLPKNPWNIKAADKFVRKISREELNAGPFTQKADYYFNDKFKQAIKDHPEAFIKRLIKGSSLMFMQGLYMPNLRLLYSDNEKEKQLIDLANETIKGKLGLSVNQYDLDAYRHAGLTLNDVKLKHYFIVITEYISRAVFALIFVILSLFLITKSLKALYKKNITYAELLTLALFSSVLIISASIQSLPRHTTLFWPLLLWVTINQFHRINKHNIQVKGN